MEGLPALWVRKHKIKNEAGLPIDFSKRAYLWDIYNDLSPKQALLKPPQIGATVMEMIKTLWVAKKLHKDVIYTLPTDLAVRDIVSGTTNRIITQNEVLREWVKDHDTIEQKSVGGNLVRYRGAFNPKQATMVPSSLNVHDEVDSSDPEILTLYQTRQEAQEREEDKWRWYFSHPSLTQAGVDVYWTQSDQKEWYITCPHCRTEQSLSWPDNIDLVTEQFICFSCKGVLETKDRIFGRWINKDGVPWEGKIVGSYEFSGWHVSQLMLFNKTAKDIIKSFNDPMKDKQFFWNYVLGLPFASSEDRITPQQVLLNCVQEVNMRETPAIIGVDTGLGLHLTVMNKQGVFYYAHENELTATKSPYDELRKLLNLWPKSKVVLDQGGELMKTRQLQQEFPGRVFLCYYNKDRKTIELAEWGDDEEYWKVKVDRNRMMSLLVEQLRDVGRIRLNGSPEEWGEFASHFGNIQREKVEIREVVGKDNRELYGTEYVWKRKGPDHFVHSLLYAIVGFQRFGGGEEAKIVGESALAGIKSGQIAVPAKEATIVSTVEPGAFSSGDRVF